MITVLKAQDTTFFSNGRPEKILVFDRNNQKTGTWIWYNENGDTSSLKLHDEKGNIKEWRQYFPSGKIRFIIISQNNIPTSQKMFYENGQLDYILNYDSTGAKTGEWKQYYQNGQLYEVGSYKRGEEVGEWRRYHQNGQIAEVGKYENGLEVGEWKYYDKSGKLKSR